MAVKYINGPLDGKADPAPKDLSVFWNYDSECYEFQIDVPDRAKEFLDVRTTFLIALDILKRYRENYGEKLDEKERRYTKRIIRRVLELTQTSDLVAPRGKRISDDQYRKEIIKAAKEMLRDLDD